MSNEGVLRSEKGNRRMVSLAAVGLLVLMGVLAGGAMLRESVTLDEVAHIGAGLSYWQRLDLRLNGEHPPLAKLIAAAPLALQGTHADYSHISWQISDRFLPAYLAEWVFGDWVLARWNNETTVLASARFPMLGLTLLLGWVIFSMARRLGGDWGGLLCLAVYVGSPVFLAFGPLVITDVAITLFTLVCLWGFAELWTAPSSRNALWFGVAFAAALLAKFTAGLLFFAFAAVTLSSRKLPLPGAPTEKAEARAWRKVRGRLTLRGILWAALIVYLVYVFFSLRQPSTPVDFLGDGAALTVLKRLLLPAWLYARGVFIVLLSSVRPSYLFGQHLPHGAWYYFPVVFLLKVPPAFLALLALAAGVGIARRMGGAKPAAVIPEALTTHWRTIWTAAIVFTGFCMLGRMDISIRHFTVPMALFTLLLAPLPRMLAEMRESHAGVSRTLAAGTAALAAICLVTVVWIYPFYMSYRNPLTFGRPLYELVADSNVDWNQSLPEVRRYAEKDGVARIKVDEYGFTGVKRYVPMGEEWSCQEPEAADAGQWAVVSANVILDAHNCAWLRQYAMEPIAGGSMYAVRLPDPIPAAGSPGGPPTAEHYFYLGGAFYDFRKFTLRLIERPEGLPAAAQYMQNMFQEYQRTGKPPTTKPPGL